MPFWHIILYLLQLNFYLNILKYPEFSLVFPSILIKISSKSAKFSWILLNGLKNCQKMWEPSIMHEILYILWNSALLVKCAFLGFFVSIGKVFILGRRLCTDLNFYEVLIFSWYFLTFRKILSLNSWSNSCSNSYIICIVNNHASFRLW